VVVVATKERRLSELAIRPTFCSSKTERSMAVLLARRRQVPQVRLDPARAGAVAEQELAAVVALEQAAVKESRVLGHKLVECGRLAGGPVKATSRTHDWVIVSWYLSGAPWRRATCRIAPAAASLAAPTG
jgi:hypothetical protein